VLLIVISSLISYSRSWDDLPLHITELADDMVATLSESTAPDVIDDMLRKLREKHRPKRFYFYNGQYAWITHHIFFSLKRGISYELLEKRLFDDLNRLLGSEPKLEAKYVRLLPHYPLTLFAEYHVWDVKKGTGYRAGYPLKLNI